MTRVLFLLLFLLSINSISQIKKDTIYICFDSTNVGMKKVSFKTFKSKKYPNERILLSYRYFIDEKKTIEPQEVDTGYTFIHYNWDKYSLEYWNLKNPLIIKKDISFLKTIKLLDINFFLTTDYNDVCKTFEAEDSWEQDVIIFMIDKEEIKDGKITMREVTFNRPVKE